MRQIFKAFQEEARKVGKREVSISPASPVGISALTQTVLSLPLAFFSSCLANQLRGYLLPLDLHADLFSTFDFLSGCYAIGHVSPQPWIFLYAYLPSFLLQYLHLVPMLELEHEAEWC